MSEKSNLSMRSRLTEIFRHYGRFSGRSLSRTNMVLVEKSLRLSSNTSQIFPKARKPMRHLKVDLKSRE